MKNVLLLETHQEILDAHMQGESPELGLYILSKITNTDISHTASKFEIGQYYPEYGVYAGIFNQNHVFVAGKNLKYSDKKEFTWDDATQLTKDIGLKLPSIGESALIQENLEAIQKGLKDNGLDELNGWYWSSSEYINGNAWFLWPGNGASQGGLNYNYKGNNYYYYVRPVLALPL